jgi:hypothetical protein
MKLLKVTLLAACLLPASMLQAEPSTESLVAAKKLAESMNLKEQMDAAFTAMMPMVDQLAGQLNLDSAGKQELIQLYKDWFEKDLDQEKMRANIIILYAESFTVQELNGLREFYTTPLGRKALKTMPEIMQRGARLNMEESKQKEQMLMNRLNAFIEKKKGAKN